MCNDFSLGPLVRSLLFSPLDRRDLSCRDLPHGHLPHGRWAENFFSFPPLPLGRFGVVPSPLGPRKQLGCGAEGRDGYRLTLATPHRALAHSLGKGEIHVMLRVLIAAARTVVYDHLNEAGRALS